MCCLLWWLALTDRTERAALVLFIHMQSSDLNVHMEDQCLLCAELKLQISFIFASDAFSNGREFELVGKYYRVLT